MTAPRRIQLSRVKGWRMPPNTVKVDRSTKWGNPYRVGIDGTAEQCVAKYRAVIEQSIKLALIPPRELPHPFGRPLYLGPLRGKNLACWCALDAPCHADVLVEIANRIGDTNDVATD